MSSKRGRNVRPQAASLLTPVSRSAPVFQSRIVRMDVDKEHAVVHVVDQLLFEQRLRAFDFGRVGDRNGRRQFPGERVVAMFEAAEPAAGQLLGEQVLILRKELAEFLDELGIELSAGELEQLGERPFARASRTVDVIGGHRVEGIDDREHAGGERNVGSALGRSPSAPSKRAACALDDFQDVLRACRNWPGLRPSSPRGGS